MNQELQIAALSLMYAKAYGIYFAVTGLALFLNPNRFKDWYQDILSEKRRAVFGGLIALTIGSFIVATHNVWVPDWRLIITLIGYWGVVVGGSCMAFDGFINIFKSVVSKSELVYRLSGIAWLLLGLYLAYQGF